MILGSVSIHVEESCSPVPETLRRFTASEDLVFNEVVREGFIGGYYLHKRLPQKPEDVCFYDEINGVQVLLSGFVFNRSELTASYKIPGQLPDPELIARMFLQEGPGFVDKLNGDFAFCITQPSLRQAYLFRDHTGIRPLAWAIDQQSLLFSSDINGLCRALADGQVIDSDYLLGSFKYIDYRKTPNNRVTKLLPGHYLHFSENGIELKQYWEPERIGVDAKLPYDQMLSDLGAILSDAVRIRCDNRFTAGAHVSSGLDSGIVSALARREYPEQENFYGFSWSPAEFVAEKAKYDEREIAAKACEKSNISLIFSDLDESSFPGIVASLYNNNGFYSEDKTLDQARNLRTNLIFSGWGGDEFISTGYRGLDLDLLAGLRLRAFFRRNPVKPLRKFVKNLLLFVIYPAFGILDSRVAESFREDARYIKKPFRKSDRRALRNFYFYRSRHQLHLRMLEFYGIQDRCETWYLMGYRKGIEYRYPLLDKRIIEYMLKIPSIHLCKTGYFRPLLREMGKGILAEEVRLHWYKNDPVYWAFLGTLFRSAADLFNEEIDDWRVCRDLHFVDFDLLSEDISRYRGKPDSVYPLSFFRSIAYIKAAYEFARKYRGS